MRCSECGQRLTGEEKYCTRCGKEVDVSGWEDKHKTAKWIAIGFCVLAVMLISSAIILYLKHNTVENTNKWIRTEEDEIQENIAVESEETDYQGMVEEFSYLVRDELFHLKLTNGEAVYIDLAGKEQYPDKLNSDYLSTDAITMDDGRVYDFEIYDLHGNNVSNRFIKDRDHEQVLGICRMDDYDIVCVLSFEETPLSSLAVVKIYDEKGNELCRVDSDNEYFKNGIDSFKRFDRVEYAGDMVCRIKDTSKQRVFSINVETGELLDPTGNFSDGYAVVSTYEGKKIQDVHGNYVVDLDGDEFDTVMDYSDGLFMSLSSGIFYNLYLNKVIDLSQYDLIWSSSADVSQRRDWSKADKEFVFKDGFCNITVKNESGTRFHGIIDTNGNWVKELSDIQTSEYDERISETKIEIGSQIYDIKTKIYTDMPSDVKGGKWVNGKYYYINDYNEFCIFTLDDTLAESDEKEEIDDDFSEQIVTKSNERDDITDQNVSEHMVDFRITASSVLQEKGYNYDPRNMADLDMTTCWADGTSGNGVGEYITFLSNSAKSVRGIAIAPGFNKSEELFSKNGVPIKVCLEYTGPEIEKETLVLAMEDYSYSSGMLYFDFEEEKRITECRVTILEVRNGSKYDDCCISEMFLYY